MASSGLLSGLTTTYGTMKAGSDDHRNDVTTDELPVGSLPSPPISDRKNNSGLHRGLSARQVQMIAIAGTIGTGLFLGTGRSLAHGGPASILICYAIIGFIVYITLLLLGEMATQYPVAGECSYFILRGR
jgi:amino acid transporter, AAT family